jgi:hypothetical protein
MRTKIVKEKHYSIVNTKRAIYATICLAFLMTSCAKEIIDSKRSISVKGTTCQIPDNFNWELDGLMPTPAGHTIYKPWAAGVSGSICSTYGSDVWSDYKAADGWVLLFNSFSQNTYVSHPYFVLYNRYRGLLRIYQYNDNPDITFSSKILSGISWAGNGNGNNKTLSFVGQSIVDLTKSPVKYSAFEPAPSDGLQQPVAPDKWYMLQYEIAYDPAITATTSSTPPMLSYYLSYYNVTDVDLGGTIKGTITSQIGSSTLDQTLSSALTGTLKPIGQIGLTALGADFFSENKLGLATGVYDAIKTGLTSALKTSVSSLPGTIINLASAILGGNSSAQTIKLDLNATLSLKGTLTNSGNLIPSNSLPMPGSISGSGSNIIGYIPLNNIKLGVLNLSNTPTIIRNWEDLTYWEWNPDTQSNQPIWDVRTRYTIDMNSFHIDWNPDVTSVATIQNIKYEVVMSADGPGYTDEGRYETLSGLGDAWTGVDSLYVINRSNWNSFGGVRISFNVVPNNGAPTSTIVKTFFANVVDSN